MSGKSEAEILSEILIAHGARSDLRIWRNNTGAAKAGNRLIRFGVPGAADISGLRLPAGQRVEIEVKTLTGRIRPEQRIYQAMIERFGGLYILARSVEDVTAVLGTPPPVARWHHQTVNADVGPITAETILGAFHGWNR